jgi:hypothetical protein
VLGHEHPYTLTTVSNLGSVLERQGKYEEAEFIPSSDVKMKFQCGHTAAFDIRSEQLKSTAVEWLISTGGFASGSHERSEAIQTKAVAIGAQCLKVGQGHSNPQHQCL